MSEIITLVAATNSKTTCQIEPMGCGIGELYLDGKQILWSGVRPDGGKGFTHPCIPNFNLAQNLPNHGPARKELWLQQNENTWSWQMLEIPEIYPAGLVATRSFKLENESITVTTAITNQGQKPLSINIAEHHYFKCEPNNRADVLVDGEAFSKSGLSGEAEFNPWQEGKHDLFVPGVGQIKFDVAGYAAFAQWSQPEANFVCVEPIQILPPDPTKFEEQAPKLLPEETKIFSYSLSLG